MRILFPVLACLSALVLLVACGDDDDNSEAIGGGSDEEYLRIICAGSRDFSNALVRETSVEGIGKSIEDFIANLQRADPPGDLEKFHADLLSYLQTALDDPTSLAVKPRPQPPEKARSRLAEKEDELPECEAVGYFTPPAN
jgi:hypothetical protein